MCLRLDQLTPALLDGFLASRPRTRPRSFNHLLGVVAGFLEWAVAQELLEVSPALRERRRRATSVRVPFLFDAGQARLLLDAAAALPDNARAAQRGPTYYTVFALCYGLGLRAGEACGLRLGDLDTERNLLVVVGGKFEQEPPRPPRAAHRRPWCVISSSVATQTVPRIPQRHCSASMGGVASILARPARCFTTWSPRSSFLSQMAFRRRGCTISDILLPLRACCGGIAKGSTRPAGSISCPPSWDTSTPPRLPSTSRSPRHCSKRPTGASRPSLSRRWKGGSNE